MSRARRLPPSGDRSHAVMVGIIDRSMVISPFRSMVLHRGTGSVPRILGPLTARRAVSAEARATHRPVIRSIPSRWPGDGLARHIRPYGRVCPGKGHSGVWGGGLAEYQIGTGGYWAVCRSASLASPFRSARFRLETANAVHLSLSSQAPGLTIEHLVGMFNWEPHTARAAISVASKRLGIQVERDGSTRAYRLPSTTARGLIA